MVTPLITVVAARYQAKLTNDVTLAKEYREVLDDGADKLAKVVRASGHLVALWSRSIPSDSEEALREFLLRNTCGELMLTAYGRICIRFGQDSEVAQSYKRAIAQIDHYLKPLGEYRAGQAYASWKSELSDTSHAVGTAMFDYMRAASIAVQRFR